MTKNLAIHFLTFSSKSFSNSKNFCISYKNFYKSTHIGIVIIITIFCIKIGCRAKVQSPPPLLQPHLFL